MERQKILYVDDMEECFNRTLEIFGNKYEIDWVDTPLEAIKTIKKDISQYSAAIFDVNLSYDPSKPDNEQTAEGLELIAMLRKEANKQGVYLPIFCVSSNNNRESALERGANEFMWKKEFWFGKGKQKLEEYLKAKI